MTAYAPMASGGDHRGDRPPQSETFLGEFLPLQNPANFQFVENELERLCGVVRARPSVEAHVKAHYARLVPAPQRKPRAYRRFRHARIADFGQHDSSIHQWWPAASKQAILLTVDNHSGIRPHLEPLRAPSLRLQNQGPEHDADYRLSVNGWLDADRKKSAARMSE